MNLTLKSNTAADMVINAPDTSTVQFIGDYLLELKDLLVRLFLYSKVVSPEVFEYFRFFIV